MQSIVLTIDVEEWYQTSGLNVPIQEWTRYESRVRRFTESILLWLEAKDIHATFFVLGCVAQEHPGLVADIVAGGHEVASHGMWHRLVNRMEPNDFRADVREAKQVLEDLAGQSVIAFRAPSWSIGVAEMEALITLEEEGYRIDSSVQPFATPLSGVYGAPVTPYYPVVRGRRLQLLECPPSVYKWGGLTIPCAGGFYLRALPYWFLRACLRKVSERHPAVVYVHPWEFDPSQPRFPVSLPVRIAQYTGIHTTERKFLTLLNDFSFVSFRELAVGDYPAIAVGRELSCQS